MNQSDTNTLNRKSPGQHRRRILALTVAAGLQMLQFRASGEDHVDYRFEAYRENDRRIDVDTHSVLFELAPSRWLNIKGEAVYDAISGASPTGAPPPSQIAFVPVDAGGPRGPFSSKVPLAEMHDRRYAGDIAATLSYDRHRFTPQFSYSEEHDYISRGFAFNYAIDLFEKNTTLNAGVSANWDRVLPKGFLSKEQTKDSDDYFIGVNQLLGPKTVLTVNFTFGDSRGYLNDQYKGVYFVNDVPQLDPTSPALEAESRPTHRVHYTTYASLTHYITPLNASVEGSYRFFADTYGVFANTVSLGWNQKIGSHVTVSPILRYSRQTAADFYAPSFPDFGHRPKYYSADYRLSELETLTGGLTVTVKATDWLWFDLGYKYYTMNGLDKVTSSSAYPSANIFTAGARIWF